MEAEDKRSCEASRRLHQVTYEHPSMAREDLVAQRHRQEEREKQRKQQQQQMCHLLLSVLGQCIERHEAMLQRLGLNALWRVYCAAAEARRQQQAVALLQRAWRRSCQRALLREARRQQQLQRAVLHFSDISCSLLQRAQQRLERQTMQHLQQHAAHLRALYTSAATRLAAAWRGYAARRDFILQKPLLLLQLPRNAVFRHRMERLQAAWRGAAVRERMRNRGLSLPCDKRRHTSATRIQVIRR